MKEAELIRKGRVIYFASDLPGKRPVYGEYKSISAAKRESSIWQKSNGGLGTGKLRVER